MLGELGGVDCDSIQVIYSRSKAVGGYQPKSGWKEGRFPGSSDILLD